MRGVVGPAVEHLMILRDVSQDEFNHSWESCEKEALIEDLQVSIEYLDSPRAFVQAD
jgi:hypothetical protein